MRDHLKTALAVFIMFAGMTIALVIGAGFAMFCFAVVTHAQELSLNREPGLAGIEVLQPSAPSITVGDDQLAELPHFRGRRAVA